MFDILPGLNHPQTCEQSFTVDILPGLNHPQTCEQSFTAEM